MKFLSGVWLDELGLLPRKAEYQPAPGGSEVYESLDFKNSAHTSRVPDLRYFITTSFDSCRSVQSPVFYLKAAYQGPMGERSHCQISVIELHGRIMEDCSPLEI
jgi:hypothetical protein